MTLKGVFAPWRANGARPGPLRTSARATSDLPTLAMAAGAGRRVRLWLPLVVALRARRRSCSRTAISARRREMVVGGARHRRGDRRRLVRVRAIWAISPRIPQTLEERFVATNSGRMESYSFVAPIAYSARAADALDRPVARAHVRHRRRARHAGRARRRWRWPRGRFAGKASRRSRTSATTSSARSDGLRRRDGARLHDRAGPDRHFDAGASARS